METAKGRRILFIDTCHSDNAYEQRLGNAAYHANIIAYTAARFDQEALEDTKLGHGLFTYAVVEGIDGNGAMKVNSQVTTKELATYVIKRVGELAKAMNREQEPQYFKGRDAEDYVLAREGVASRVSGGANAPAALIPSGEKTTPLPVVFRVFGVKQGDVLNVREQPSADDKIVVQIPRDATNVEVQSCLGSRQTGAR